MSKPSFTEFIRGLLRTKTFAKETFIQDITTSRDIADFRRALTHWTDNPDPRGNGDIDEFMGDGIIYAIETTWLPQRFPKIYSEKWLTRIKHGISNKKALSMFAYESDFLDYISYGPEAQAEIDRDPDPNTNCRVASMLEDAFEAFVGCLVKVIDRKYPVGIGYTIVNQFLLSYLNALDISLDPKKLFDPVTRLKELYESKVYQIRWPLKDTYQIIRPPEGGIRVNVYGWPRGDLAPIPRNKVLLASVYSEKGDEHGTKHTAADIALNILAKNYNIVENVPNASEIILKTKWTRC